MARNWNEVRAEALALGSMSERRRIEARAVIEQRIASYDTHKEAADRLLELDEALDGLYWIWEKDPTGVLHRSSERPRGRAAFYVHTAADKVEFEFEEAAHEWALKVASQTSLPEWDAFLNSRVLDRLGSAVAAIMGLSDDELSAMKPRNGWSVGEFRSLVSLLMFEVTRAIADRNSERLRGAIFDLQLALDPAP